MPLHDSRSHRLHQAIEHARELTVRCNSSGGGPSMKPARYQPLAIASRRSREARRRTVTSHLKKNGSGVISKPNKVQIRSSTAEYLQKIWRTMRRQRRGIRAELSFTR